MILTKVDYENISGDKVNVAAVQPPKRRSAVERTPQHLGWSAQGFPPGHIAETEKRAHESWKRWLGYDEGRRASLIKNGNRPPKAWDLALWLQTAKPQRVRGRPFAIESAANECADLARRSGWEHVRVVELVRE